MIYCHFVNNYYKCKNKERHYIIMFSSFSKEKNIIKSILILLCTYFCYWLVLYVLSVVISMFRFWKYDLFIGHLWVVWFNLKV